jgi:hypothetical protein
MSPGVRPIGDRQIPSVIRSIYKFIEKVAEPETLAETEDDSEIEHGG